jgi:hypothetical protein
MKNFILYLIFTFSSVTTFGQVDSCNEFKTGVFQFLGGNGGVYTVIRTDSTQFEQNSKQAQHSKMKIRWDSDCSYTLYDRVEYQWGKQPIKDEEVKEIKNIVYKFEKLNKFYVSTFIPNYSDTIKTVFTKLDTTKFYNNLFQLKEFAEYKNSKAYGQTLLGEIHSIDYYESNKIPNKYLITFETTYQEEMLNKTRLIDTVVVLLKDGENITNSNCRFNGEFDDEIVAIYNSQNEEKEARIIKAFRCNRNSEKIEEIDIKKVNYKEADRNRIKW